MLMATITGKRKLSKYAISCQARLKFIAEIKVITAKASGRFTTSGKPVAMIFPW